MRFLFAAIVVALTLVPSAQAKADLRLSPDPPRVGEQFTVSGCGYTPSAWINVYFAWNYEFKHQWNQGPANVSLASTTDASGCFSMTRPEAVCYQPCLYSILAVQMNKAGTSDSPRAKIVFEVH